MGCTLFVRKTPGLCGVPAEVVVAVALLLRGVTLGLMSGRGDINFAFGARFLLAINVVCVNSAMKVIFLVTGVHPRTW